MPSSCSCAICTISLHDALPISNGDKLFTSVLSPVNSLGHFSITNVNENPEATLRWLDYFWSDEGAKMFFMGLERETYEETDDGPRSEEHTSELQSRGHLVCRLLARVLSALFPYTTLFRSRTGINYLHLYCHLLIA